MWKMAMFHMVFDNWAWKVMYEKKASIEYLMWYIYMKSALGHGD